MLKITSRPAQLSMIIARPEEADYAKDDAPAEALDEV